MAFVMRDGEGKAALLWSRCADEAHCQAELLLLLESAPAGKVLGDYEVDPKYPVHRFLQSYKGDKLANFQQKLKQVKESGFKFPEVGVLRLTPGVDQPESTSQQRDEREQTVRSTVEHYLPDFAKAVKTMQAEQDENEGSSLLLHQDAFAAGYHTDEFTLLGLAVKYAGLHGVNVTIICGK